MTAPASEPSDGATPMQALIYLRVSTDEQTASGAGLEAQHDAAVTCCERAGWPVAGPYADEGVSGAIGLEGRPALLEAIADLTRGDVLVVAKRDRLGRDPIAVAMIEAAVTRRGARVVSAAGEGTADDEPANVLMRRIVDAFAEYERLLIKSRTRSALRAEASPGRADRPGPLRLDARPRRRAPDARPAGAGGDGRYPGLAGGRLEPAADRWRADVAPDPHQERGAAVGGLQCRRDPRPERSRCRPRTRIRRA